MKTLGDYFVYLGVAMLLASVVLMLSLALAGDPRLADGELGGDEATSAEMVLLTLAPAAVIIAVFLSAARAFKAGQNAWGFVCLFIWPMSFVYSLFVYKHPSTKGDDTGEA